MKTSIKSQWLGNLKFDSRIDGHSVVTDAPVQDGGEGGGPSPKKLMLAAVAGCTGVDVAMILKKMKVEIDDLVISVDAEQTEETPATYTGMHLTYEFYGKGLDPEKLKRAVALSQDKYCGVSLMYRQFMDISWEINIRE